MQNVCQSSAKDEYYAIATTNDDITWLSCLATDMWLFISAFAPSHCDSTSAIQIASNPGFMSGQNTLRLIATTFTSSIS